MIWEYSRKICFIREDFDKKHEKIEINIQPLYLVF